MAWSLLNGFEACQNFDLLGGKTAFLVIGTCL